MPTAKDPCLGKTSRQRGRCITDTLNALAREQKAFGEQQREETAAWKAEHQKLGVSEEYRKLLSEFQKTQLAARKAFQAHQLAVRKALYAGQTEFRTTSSSSSSAYTRALTGKEASSAKAACAKVTDDRALRICLRNALQVKDPAVKPWFQR